MEETRKTTQTPEETAREMSELADRLDEMDRTEGFFGEAVTDDELEDVAGGILLTPSRQPRCAVCGLLYQQYEPPTSCMDPKILNRYVRLKALRARPAGKKGDCSMKDMNKKTRTPEETAQALSELADRLAEMDNAEGVFGEAMSEEDLDAVAGGQGITQQPDTSYATCQQCGTRFPYSTSKNPVQPQFCSEACRINYNTRGGAMSTDGSGGNNSGQRSMTWAELRARSHGGK